MNFNHVCTLESEKGVYKSNFKCDYTQISTRNPKTKSYFRSMASIEKERRRHIDKYIYIVHPLSIFRFIWIIIYTCIIYISLLIVPLSLNNSQDRSKNEYTVLSLTETILDFICMIDLVFTFFVGIHTNTEIVLSPGFIARQYLKSLQFYIDCFTCFPQYLITNTVFSPGTNLYKQQMLKYVQYYSVIKICRLRKLLVYYNDIMENFHDYFYTQSIFKFIMLLVLLMHWITCIYVAVLLSNNHFDLNYYQSFPTLNHAVWATRDKFSSYSLALYIATSTITTSGSSEYQLSVNYQIHELVDTSIFILMSVFGFIMYALSLVLILQITMSMNASKTKYQEIISQVKKYISHKDLPPKISDRVLTYYEYRYQKRFSQEKKILVMLSESLRKDLYLHLCRTLIEKVALLKDLPPEIITEVVSNLKKEVFLYNDVIVKAGTSGDCMYFIANGSVAVSTPTGKEICHLQDGTYFGEIALISKEQKRVANVVAIEICEMYRLDRKNFKTCFLANTNQYKRIEQIAKERMEKTILLEALHKKYITDKSKRKSWIPKPSQP